MKSREGGFQPESQRAIYAFNFSYYPGVCKMGEACGAKVDKKIEVVFEGGVFKPLGDVKLKEGTEAFVVIKPRGILEAARRHRIKVDRDLLEEFIEERR